MRSPEAEQVVHQRVLLLLLGEGEQLAQRLGLLAAVQHLVHPQRIDPRHPQQPPGVGGGRGVEDVDVDTRPRNIRSTMFSNMADSSKAGFMVADSTNSSALVLMSAKRRNQLIFSRISLLDRSMVSRVSIS